VDFQCPESVVAVSNSILNLGSCQLLWAGDSGSPSISAHVARVATFPIVYPEEPLVTPSLFHPMLNREAKSNGRLLDFSAVLLRRRLELGCLLVHRIEPCPCLFIGWVLC